MGSLRKAMGMIRAGFEMLNDFMDEVFQGILPAAFVAKYGNRVFQSALTEAFDQPTKHEQLGAKDKVRATVELKPVSRGAQAKNILNRVRGVLSSPLFRAAGYLAIGTGLAFAIDDAVEQAQLAKLYPANWTLFDFTDVVNQLDYIEVFLGSGEVNGQCNTYQALQDLNASYTVINCQRFGLENYYATQSSVTSIQATSCWATADVSIGQSSLFACTPTSTCCASEACTPCDPTDPSCTSMVPCFSCPEPAHLGTARYACDTYQHLCRCNVALQAVDACSSNADCGASSQCLLQPALGATVYGSTPCTTCPSSNVLCVLSGSSLPGQCTCLLESSVPLDVCAAQPGSTTTVDVSQLCGYLAPPNSLASSSQASVQFNDLVMIPCIQVEQAVCVTAYMTSGSSVLLTVAVRLLGSTRRRLLKHDDPADLASMLQPRVYAYESEFDMLSAAARHAILAEPGWNQTSQPCAGLVRDYLANEFLGPVDSFELSRCVYWRYVARRLVNAFDLASVPDTFLLSVEDFSAALATRDAANEILTNPLVLVRAALFHPWARPLRALGTTIANIAESMLWNASIATQAREAEEDIWNAIYADLPPDYAPPKPRPRFVHNASVARTTTRRLLSLSSGLLLGFRLGGLSGWCRPGSTLRLARS